MNPENNSKARELVELGCDIVGASVGGALGFFTIGPLGAAAGGAAGVLATKALSKFADGVLSSREKEKVGIVAAIAFSRIDDRLSSGDQLRDDGFFSYSKSGASDAEQIFDGVLMKSKTEYEELKLPYLGYLIANIAFSKDISLATASLLLRVLEELSYRQLCLLAFIQKNPQYSFQKLRQSHQVDPDIASLQREEMSLHSSDLGTSGLLGGGDPWTDQLSRLGRIFYQLTELDRIQDGSLSTLKNILNRVE